MLSKLLKEKIELAFGQQVKYPRDCDALAADIATKTNQRISGSTIRRLFGFITGTSEPRSFTLDVIAEYVGYTCFEQLIESFKDNPNEGNKVIEVIDSVDLMPGEKINISFDQASHIYAEFIGDSKFSIEGSTCELIRIQDTVTISKIKLHHPLFIEDLIRDKKNLGSIVVGRLSGVKLIELIK